MGDTSYVKGASVDVAAALDDLYASIPAGDFIVSTGGPETGTAGDAPGTTRTALGLGGAATLNVGTTAGTVAAGNDSRITGALQASSNLSDVANAATARTNLGTFGVVTYTGANFTAEAGNESASISTGAITLTASSTSRAYGTGGATAARAVLPIPAGARDIIVTIKVTAASGLSTGGFRWLGIGLRNAADGGAPTRLWGVGLSDATTYGVGDLMGGANGAGASTGITGVGLGSADRWYSLTFQHRMHFAGILGATGSGTPTAWATVANVVSATTAGVLARADTVAGANALAIWLQSFGGGGAGSITFTVSVEVVTGP